MAQPGCSRDRSGPHYFSQPAQAFSSWRDRMDFCPIRTITSDGGGAAEFGQMSQAATGYLVSLTGIAAKFHQAAIRNRPAVSQHYLWFRLPGGQLLSAPFTEFLRRR